MLLEDLFYVGVNDRTIDLFEGMYTVPNGISYNSYVIMDEKIAVLDTVDAEFTEEWLQNLEKIFCGKEPDFLIVQHMEPDHSANVLAFVRRYPKAKIVASAKALLMMKNYFGTDFPQRQISVSEGDILLLGKHTLTFFAAPMVHWPEVIMTYDKSNSVLFSADAFGKFGALDVDEEWACEARRYYFGIVGKYGAQVQAVLKKIASVPVRAICPLHGPILTERLEEYFALYDTWSRYEVEADGVVIAYTSVYGNTRRAVECLQQELQKAGCPKVVVIDLARSDISAAVEAAFRYGKLVLATTTYNGEIFPPMREFIASLVERNFQNRTVALIENGSWAPMAAKTMYGMLEKCKNLRYTRNLVKIYSCMTEENCKQLQALAAELCE